MSRAKSKKYYHYVMVLTESGPTLVTQVEYYPSKIAHWEKLQKPVEFDAARANDLVLGLNLNGSFAFHVILPFELEKQPYMYEKGSFKWIPKTEESEDNTNEQR